MINDAEMSEASAKSQIAACSSTFSNATANRTTVEVKARMQHDRRQSVAG